ncbi:MAG: 50S ribosomal protein L5 [Candidatus Niyogibacteria bacterium]|nr:50S ribosomal protein L5 [Candidatus Niyogibacteria bacterium]
MTADLKENLMTGVKSKLAQELGVKNEFALPRLVKIVLNTGTGRREAKDVELIQKQLELISGQKCVARQAKKSIASFKTRKGMAIGLSCTLRGRRMYDFLLRLINISLARLRDFRGLDVKLVDSSGNLTIGFKEHIVFPEIAGEDVKALFGLEVTLVVKSRSREEAIAFYRALGIPFKK